MKIDILWASMFGNAEDVAQNFEDLATKRAHEVNLVELNDVTPEKLQEMKFAVVATSTTGQGEHRASTTLQEEYSRTEFCRLGVGLANAA